MPPKVSIVVPMFNRSATILRALHSISAQTFEDYEIIAVDDHSTDNTAELVAAKKIERLTLVRHPQNRGAAAARNTGIRASRGLLIAFLDSDDTWHPEKLMRQMSVHGPGAARAMASTTGFSLHRRGQTFSIKNSLRPGQFRRDIVFGCSISPGTTLMVDRAVFDHIGLFDEAFNRLEDWDWLLRYADKYDLVSVPEILAEVYAHEAPPDISAGFAETVTKALALIQCKHAAHIDLGKRRKQLLSSLLIERAAIQYRRGQTLSAAFTVVKSFAVYPFRNAAFFRTIWRVMLRIFFLRRD